MSRKGDLSMYSLKPSSVLETDNHADIEIREGTGKNIPSKNGGVGGKRAIVWITLMNKFHVCLWRIEMIRRVWVFNRLGDRRPI